MTSKVTIHCPDCSKTYPVPEKYLGRKVTCSNSDCRVTFVARLKPEPVSEVIDNETFESLEEYPDLPPISSRRDRHSVDAPSEPVVIAVDPQLRPPALTSTCRFALLGRVLLLAGMFLLIVGAVLPSTVDRGSEGQATFNFPMFSQKLTAVLVGMSLAISGAAIWSGSTSRPSIGDTVLFVAGTVGVVLVTLKGIV